MNAELFGEWPHYLQPTWAMQPPMKSLALPFLLGFCCLGFCLFLCLFKQCLT